MRASSRSDDDRLPGPKEIMKADGRIVLAARGRTDLPFVPFTHRGRNGYTRGCRCPGCSAGNTEYMREYRQRKKS